MSSSDNSSPIAKLGAALTSTPPLLPAKLTGFKLEDLRDLNNMLGNFVTLVSPNERDHAVQQRVKELLTNVAQQCIDSSAKVMVFGSAASGLGERGCDVDASIVVAPDILEKKFGDQGSDACAKAVELIGRHLRKPEWEGWGIKVHNVILTAKIPICVLATAEGYMCDLSINNQLPTFNTKLLELYSLIDPNVRPLVLVVKHWAKILGICDAKNGHLSSYSWTLMCIYYLQVRPQGPLLPSLQQIAVDTPLQGEPSIFFDPIKRRNFDVTFARLDEARTRSALSLIGTEKREASLAELFHGFLKFYYETFDWGKEVVSVRLGTRQVINDPSGVFSQLGRRDRRDAVIHIEDPFELERNLNCVLFFDRCHELRSKIRMYGEFADTDFHSVVVMLAESGAQVSKAYEEHIRYMERQQYLHYPHSQQGTHMGAHLSHGYGQSFDHWGNPVHNARGNEQGSTSTGVDLDRFLESLPLRHLAEVVHSLMKGGQVSKTAFARIKAILKRKVQAEGLFQTNEADVAGESKEESHDLKEEGYTSSRSKSDLDPRDTQAGESLPESGVRCPPQKEERFSQSDGFLLPPIPTRGFYTEERAAGPEGIGIKLRVDCW